MSISQVKRGKIVVFVAPSGSGKTTIAKRILQDFPQLKFSVSATTRPPRDGEQNGVDYFFLSKEAFDERLAKNDFLEWEEFYGGKRYGTLRSEVEKQLNSGYFCLLDVEVKGALNVKKLYGDECITLFIQPPSMQELERRLRTRGTESDDSLKVRLERAEMELSLAHNFDKVIVNDELERAYHEVKQTLNSFIND